MTCVFVTIVLIMFDQESIVVAIVICMCLVGSMTVCVKRKAIAGILGNTELEVRTAPVAAGHSVNR